MRGAVVARTEPTPSSRERCEKNRVWGTFCFEKLVKRNCSGPVSASQVHPQPAAEPSLNCAVCQADGSMLLVLHCHLHFYSLTCSVTLSVQFHSHLQFCTVTCSATLSVQFYSVICSFALSLAVLHCHLQFCTVTCSFALSFAVLHCHLQFYSISCSFTQFYLADSCIEVCELFCVCV